MATAALTPLETTEVRKGAYVALAFLSLINVVNYFDRMLLVLLSQPIKEEFALSDTQLSMLSGLSFVAIYSVAGVVLARLADRKSRRVLLAVVLAGWSALTLVCGISQSYVQLLFARAGVAMGEAGCIPTAYSLISDYFGQARRVAAMAVFSAGSTLGIFLCFVIGSQVHDAFGWRPTFMLAAVPGFILAIAVALLLREPPREQTSRVEAVSERSFSAALRELLQNRAYLWLIGAQSIAAFGSVGILQWLPSFLMRTHGVSVGQVGLLFGPAIALGMTLGLAVGGWAGARLTRISPAKPVLLCACSTAALAPLYWLALWAPDRQLAIVAVFAATLVSVIAVPTWIASMQSVCDSAIRATAAAWGLVLSSLVGQGLLPLAAGILSDQFAAHYESASLRMALTITVASLIVGAFMFDRARAAMTPRP